MHGAQYDFVVQISDVSFELTCVAKYGVKGNTMKKEQSFIIGSLARELDVCVETIRYYHRIGLIPVPKPKAGGGIRIYSWQDLSLLQFVKRAQRLGFTLDEIRGLITLSEGKHCAEVYQMAQEKLLALEEKMLEIAKMRNAIFALTQKCPATQEAFCPLIEALRQAQKPDELTPLCEGQVE